MKMSVLLTLVSVVIAVTHARSPPVCPHPLIQKSVPFIVEVYTGNKGLYAGTDANVYIKDHFEKKILQNSKTHKGLKSFERGNKDVFDWNRLPSELDKITIGHDNANRQPGWFLDKVVIYRKSNPELKYTFHCNRWLSTTNGVERVLTVTKPKRVTYIVEVYTGNKSYAGTDANVFIKDRTGKTFLKNSKTHKGSKKFEKGKKDVFEWHRLPYKLDEITIGHDNSDWAPGWFLDKVVIYRKSNTRHKITFLCNRWLAKSEDDKKIVRTLKARAKRQILFVRF